MKWNYQMKTRNQQSADAGPTPKQIFYRLAAMEPRLIELRARVMHAGELEWLKRDCCRTRLWYSRGGFRDQLEQLLGPNRGKPISYTRSRKRGDLTLLPSRVPIVSLAPSSGQVTPDDLRSPESLSVVAGYLFRRLPGCYGCKCYGRVA
jgi:hypothetical protein